MTTGTVDHRVVDDVAVITISQPGRLNAWTRAMRHELLAHIERVSLEPDALEVAIVITGAGNAFCSGQDLTEARDWNAAFASTWVPEFKELYDAVRTCPKPVVAAINGVAAGSGFQFALCCDLRVSHRDARLGQPEIRSGLASVTGAWLIEQAVGHTRMQQLVLSAELIDAVTAHDWGIVDELVPEAQVLDQAVRAAKRLAQLPTQSFALTKQALVELTRTDYEHAFDVAAQQQAKVYATGESEQVMTEFVTRTPGPARIT